MVRIEIKKVANGQMMLGIAVRSIAMTLSSSEGGRVNGGVPRRG